MTAFAYDPAFDPPVPVLTVWVRSPITANPPMEVRLLVDSGADQTVLPLSVVEALNIPIEAWIPVFGFGGPGSTLGEYTVELTLPGLAAEVIRILAIRDSGDPVLGRDVLNRYRLVLDGPNQTLEIG